MREHRAFTLIELLVVIAIIALLIGILLPALRSARETGRAVVCLSNQRQMATTMFKYANDNEVIPGAYWEGPINLDWSGRNNASYRANPDLYDHPIDTSVLRDYLESIDEMFECPTAKREANHYYDYTMAIRMAGARPDLLWNAVWPEEPPLVRRGTRWHRFQALPLLIEEDEIWYNSQNDDGSWANRDQFADRHDGNCTIAYIDGSASPFRSPKGRDPRRQERDDLESKQLKLMVGGREYSIWYGEPDGYGWVNGPTGRQWPN